MCVCLELARTRERRKKDLGRDMTAIEATKRFLALIPFDQVIAGESPHNHRRARPHGPMQAGSQVHPAVARALPSPH